MGDITWSTQKRKLSDLIPWPRNPREINQEQAKRLAESFDEFGQVETIAIGPDNEVYNGHQRLNVLMAKFGGEYEVEVRVSSRPLTEKEREKLTIFLHKGTTGEWNFDLLANNWEIPDLMDWGFKPYELGLQGEGNDPNAEWKGMPDFEQEDKSGISLTIHFENMEDREEFFNRLDIYHTDKTNSIWYPERPEDIKNQLGTGLVYTHES